MSEQSKLPLVVLISGSGSNLQAIIDHIGQGLPARIEAVISNQPSVYGLELARLAGIETRVLDHRVYPEREHHDKALGDLVSSFNPKLIVLAGFMRILSPGFVRRFEGRMLNIHPSLLPRHRGLHTHQRALDAGDKEHGASVHFVTDELDGGPLILQARVNIEPGDDADTLAARVLTREHIIYPRVIEWVAEGRLRLKSDRVLLDEKPLDGPMMLESGDS